VLLPLLATLSAFPSTLDGGLSGRGPARAGSRSYVTLDENGTDCLFTGGVSSRDVEQLLSSFWLFATMVVNQGVAHHAIPERRDDISVS
jgi:hypothetical protein